MASEARIDDKLLLVIGLGKLEEQDLGGEVVDVGQPQGSQALLELVGDDFDVNGGETLLHDGAGIESWSFRTEVGLTMRARQSFCGGFGVAKS